jgi:hypothetical protein
VLRVRLATKTCSNSVLPVLICSSYPCRQSVAFSGFDRPMMEMSRCYLPPTTGLEHTMKPPSAASEPSRVSLGKSTFRALEGVTEHVTLRTALLICGALAAIWWVLIDVFGSLRYPGYSYVDQTISELSAVGAPTRTFMMTVSGIPTRL